MVLMSLVKSPIPWILFCFGNTTARPVRGGHADMFGCGYQCQPADCEVVPPRGENLVMEHRNMARDAGVGIASAKTRISYIRTYVRHMTAAPIEGCSQRCQGLHNGPFLPYGSSYLERLAAACRQSLYYWASNLLPPCREDECTDC